MRNQIIQKSTDQQGFTLIEVLVTIVLLGIMASIAVSVFSALFNAVTQSQQMYDQQSNIQVASGYLNSHLGNADRPVGLLNDGDSAIDPLSIAGDQLIFNNDGNCYRIFYLTAEEQLRAQVAASCSDFKIAPVRGPNQVAANGTLHAQPSDPDYDPALDAPLGSDEASFVLADNVVPTKPSTAPAGAPSPLQVFAYTTDEHTALLPDSEASNAAGGHSSFYADPGNRELVAGVDLTLYVEASAQNPQVRSRSFTQEIWLGQTFTDSTAPGATPSRGAVDGTDPGTWKTVTQASGWVNVERDGAGSILQTPEIGTQEAWIEFNGQLELRPKISGVTGAELRAQLLKNGVPISSGRSYFSYPTGQVNANRGFPFTGTFEIPTATADPGDTYRIRISVRNLDASHELEYSTALASEWLSWKVVTK